MRIELLNGYYVDVDTLNFVLKQTYVSKKKDGSEVESERTVGYYGHLKGAIEQYLRETQNKDNATETIMRYVERIEKSNKSLASTLERLWTRIYEQENGRNCNG